MNLLSIDLNTVRFNAQSYQNLIESTAGSDLEIHIYNYIEQKHCKLPFYHGEILHKYSGSRKKVALDIKQAVDIVELCTKNFYHNVFVLCGEYESEFLFYKLKEMGVPYQKVSLANYRQTDANLIEFSHPDLKQNQTNNKSHIKSTEQETNSLSTQENTENIDNEITSFDNNVFEEEYIDDALTKSNLTESNLKADNGESKIIPFENNQIIGEKLNTTCEVKTKLTPQQIKKIYSYLKLKQMESKLKSV